MIISNLFIYPIKSLAPVTVQSSGISPMGLEDDRQMMLVDENGKFVSQRTFPELSQFNVSKSEQGWRIEHGNSSVLVIPEIENAMHRPVSLWKSKFEATSISAQIDQWFSDQIKKKVSLVRYDSRSPRIRKKGKSGFELGFQDGYPILVSTTDEIDQLTQKTGQVLSILRFRPNIVVRTEEIDQFYEKKDLYLADLKLKHQKPCVRCKVITINPSNGVIDQPELLKDLRKNALGQPIFGQQYIPQGKGTIKVGDRLTN